MQVLRLGNTHNAPACYDDANVNARTLELGKYHVAGHFA